MAHSNNFNAVRLVLASLVFLGHYSWIFPDSPINLGILSLLVGDIAKCCVQAFFVISGFLMFQSLRRSSSIWRFYERRARRILPGYVTVIFLSAICGLILTDLPTRDYLGPELVKYIVWNLTFLNFVHPTLPGVFVTQPLHVVNGSLWTMKIEILFYVLFPVIFRIGKKIGLMVTFCWIYIFSVIYSQCLTSLSTHSGSHLYIILAEQLPGQLCYFMAGAVAAAAYDHLGRFSLSDFLKVAPVAAIGIAYTGRDAFTAVVVATVILFLCLRAPRVGDPAKYGDLSYGIYIIHFPIIQSARAINLLSAFPLARICVVTCTVFGLAALLWHVVERPALTFRRKTSLKQSFGSEAF